MILVQSKPLWAVVPSSCLVRFRVLFGTPWKPRSSWFCLLWSQTKLWRFFATPVCVENPGACFLVILSLFFFCRCLGEPKLGPCFLTDARLAFFFFLLSHLRLLSRNTQQSKAFLVAHPRLSQKLEAAVKEKLAAGDSHILAEAAENIPSDAPSLAASSEPPDAPVGDSTASPPVGGVADETSSSSRDAVPEKSKGGGPGVVGGEAEVLLEPGVASVEELLKSDVFSKSPVSRAGKTGATGSKPGDVGTSEGRESKEKLRA